MDKDFDDLGDGALQQEWHAAWLKPAWEPVLIGVKP